MSLFEELREKYSRFVYEDYRIEKTETGYRFAYCFRIPELCEFHPLWEFPASKDVNGDILNALAFHLGLAETISYWKCACPPELEIACGALSKEQVAWWNKLYYNGLGEFMYRNGISVEQDDLVRICCAGEAKGPLADSQRRQGCLIPVGGGKDSVVSLELLKDREFSTFSINGNQTTANIVNLCEGKKGNYNVRRVLDGKLLELNAQGFLNGHTPFSAIVAFSSVITAYLNGIRDVVLSNETSANETTVRDSFVNHQYSKSYEFEQDFDRYLESIVKTDIRYFSLLRPLTEMQIAYLFSGYGKYHRAFRSCNAGSKKGIWCCNCPKCLFVYIILTPFLPQEELTAIFGENLLDKESLDKEFRELTGIAENKPFECVGTRKEVLVALKEFIKGGGSSLLTDRYRETIMRESGELREMLANWTKEHSVPEEYAEIVKRQIVKWI